jgi:hypothetical protein
VRWAGDTRFVWCFCMVWCGVAAPPRLLAGDGELLLQPQHAVLLGDERRVLLAGLRSLPGVRLVTWLLHHSLAVVNWCFDCKMTW